MYMYVGTICMYVDIWYENKYMHTSVCMYAFIFECFSIMLQSLINESKLIILLQLLKKNIF